MSFITAVAILTYFLTGIYFVSPAFNDVKQYVKRHIGLTTFYLPFVLLIIFADAVAKRIDEKV